MNCLSELLHVMCFMLHMHIMFAFMGRSTAWGAITKDEVVVVENFMNRILLTLIFVLFFFQQIPITLRVQHQIVLEFGESLPDICQSIDAINTTLPYLITLKVTTDQRLHIFMMETLRMRDTEGFQSRKVCFCDVSTYSGIVHILQVLQHNNNNLVREFNLCPAST